MNEEERDELLIRLDERTDSLITQFTNHIRHHWMLTVPLVLALVGLVIKLLI